MRPGLSLVVLCLVVGLSACESWNWKRSANETLKNICKDHTNCYATCPDGTRTNPNDPYCPGDLPQEQPDRF